MKEEIILWYKKINYFSLYCWYYIKKWWSNFIGELKDLTTKDIHQKLNKPAFKLLIFNYTPEIFNFLNNKNSVIFIDTKCWKQELDNLDFLYKYLIFVNDKNSFKYYKYLKSGNHKIQKVYFDHEWHNNT